MNIRCCLTVVTILVLCLAPAPARSEVNDEHMENVRKLYPLRIRDMSFPGVVILGFEPSPARVVPKGSWFYEAHYSESSNFILSDNVEDYVEVRDDDSRGLDATDVAALEALGEEVFYVDGEVGRFDINFHYGLTDHLELVAGASYLTYTGGSLDSLIYNFHDTFSIDQNGRDKILEDQFQILFIDIAADTRFRDSSPGGGIADPTIRLRWAGPTLGKNWDLGLEAAVKIAVGDEDQAHSSGNEDFGLQFAANKTWKKTGLVLNAYYISAGDFEQVPSFEQSDPLGFSAAYLRTFGSTFTFIGQVLSQTSLFDDVTDSSLSDPEFQASLGFTARVAPRSFFQFSYTNNFKNYDNTPDLVFHLGFSQFFE